MSTRIILKKLYYLKFVNYKNVCTFANHFLSGKENSLWTH